MITSQQAIDETIRILTSNLPDVSGKTGGSHAYGFYQVTKTIFVKFRIADHGLYMQTFISHDNGVKPELVSIISVVYRESPKRPIGTKWKTNGYPNHITAYQYIYPCWEMEIKDISPIAYELIHFATTNTFIPPHLCTKNVRAQEIISDVGIRDITKSLKAIHCSIDESRYNNKQKNIDRKMSKINTIRLTESELKSIISESVKKVLREGKFENNRVPNGGWFSDDEETGEMTYFEPDPWYDEYNSPDAKKKRNDRFWKSRESNQRLWVDYIWDDKNDALKVLKSKYESLKQEVEQEPWIVQWQSAPNGQRISWNKDLELWELLDGGYAIIVRLGKEKMWSNG